MNEKINKFWGNDKPAAAPKAEDMPKIQPDEAVDASDRCGRAAARGMFPGVILEMPNGDFEGVYYGAILGRVRLDPSRGITFVFEDADGTWKVTITGNNLHDLHRDLTLMRREAIHSRGESVSDITIAAFTPPGKK